MNTQRPEHQPHTAYPEFSANLTGNTISQLRKKNGPPYVAVSPLAARRESISLQRLRKQIPRRLPHFELAALLREVDIFTNFAAAFTYVANAFLSSYPLSQYLLNNLSD